MGKKIKYFFVIVFFPITIIFIAFRQLYKVIRNKIIKKVLAGTNIRSVDNLSGYEFEELLYYLLSSIGFKVYKTKRSRDYGADLIINYAGKKIVIQSKLYYKSSVGISAVQEVMGAKEYYGAEYGMVITNSKYSRPAENLASSTNIVLLDREFLKLMLNTHIKKSHIIEKFSNDNTLKLIA